MDLTNIWSMIIPGAFVLYAIFTMWILLDGPEDLIYRIKNRKNKNDDIQAH